MQLVVVGQLARLGAPGALIRTGLSHKRVITDPRAAAALPRPEGFFAPIARLAPDVVTAVGIDLTLDRRRRPAQPLPDRVQRLVGHDPDVDLDTVTQR